MINDTKHSISSKNWQPSGEKFAARGKRHGIESLTRIQRFSEIRPKLLRRTLSELLFYHCWSSRASNKLVLQPKELPPVFKVHVKPWQQTSSEACVVRSILRPIETKLFQQRVAAVMHIGSPRSVPNLHVEDRTPRSGSCSVRFALEVPYSTVAQ